MNINRFGGLATGMDTQQMIQDLMKAHRKPVDKLKQQRQVLDWRRSAYRSMNTLLLSFRHSTVSAMRLSSTFLAKTATSSDASIVTATAPATAANGNYAVAVHSLASTAYRTGTSAVSADGGNKVDADAVIWSQQDRFVNQSFDWIHRTADQQFTLTDPAGTLQLAHGWLVESQNAPTVTVGEVQFNVFYDELQFNAANAAGPEADTVLIRTGQSTGELVFNKEVSGEVAVTGYEYNTRTFDVNVTTYNQDGSSNQKTLTVNAVTESLNQVLNRISVDKELGLTAFYESSADRVSISTTRTGDNNPGGDEIQVGATGFLAEVLHLGSAVEQGGTNASVTVNGMTIERATNDLTLNNVSFSLKAEGTSTVTVGSDTEAVFQQIKSFIEEYNGLLDKINGKLQEERFRTYLPLMDEDKENLTDRQIDQWEEKARSGLLRHDPILSGIVNQLRKDVFSAVAGLDPSMQHLTHVGISVGTLADQGKLVIDESKLREAINRDPEGVAALFNQNGSTSEQQGIGRRFYNFLDTAMKRITAQAGSSGVNYDQSWIGRQIGELDKRVDLAEKRMERLEDRYWKQFTALERAINQMNSQSMWLAQQFGGMLNS